MKNRDDDPSIALREGRHLRMIGDYENSLSQFVWFFENAVRINPSLKGVRRSFALGYWKDLADVYPPATDAMNLTLQRSVAHAKAHQDRSAFLDVEALAACLGKEEVLIELLKDLTREAPCFALSVYPLVCITVASQGRHAGFCHLLGDHKIVFRREAEVLLEIIRNEKVRTSPHMYEAAINRFECNCRLLRNHLNDCCRDVDSQWVLKREHRVLSRIRNRNKNRD